MRPWLRRLTYFLVILVWLIIVSLPALAFFVAMNEQVQFGSDPQSHVRIFLLQDQDAQGVGLEWARRTDGNCARTSLRYWLWEGNADPISYCQCYDEITGSVLPTELSTCE